MKKILITLLLAAIPTYAQVQLGKNVQIGAGGTGSGNVSGQANGVVPLATGTTTIGAQSHLSDNGTKITSTLPIAVNAGSQGGTLDATEGTPATATAGHEVVYADATTHQLNLSNNGFAFSPVCTLGNGVCGSQLTSGASGSMARFFDTSVKPMSQKVIAWVGDSTVQSKNKLFTELTTYASNGGVLTGMTTTPLNIDGGTTWVINAGNIWNLGVNGQTASGMVSANWIPNTVCTYNPDLIILRGLGINDIRTGTTTQNALQGSLNSLVSQIQTNCPWTDVLWTTENSLLTTDPGSFGFVTATSTTETFVDGGTSGVTGAGSHVVTLAAMPTSLFIGGTVVINSGLGDQETVTITALTNITFTATFAATHAQGFTVGATMPVAAQAYSNILLNSVGQLTRAFPGVATYDLQSALYGTIAPATSTYMLNQLHPSDAGSTAEADLIGNVVMPALRYRPAPANTILYATWGRNVLPYSSSFSNWSLTNTTVSGNQLTSSGSNNVFQAFNVSPSTQYTYSFYAKLGTLSAVQYAVYDQTNGSFIVASTHYESSLNANTWTRISVTFTTASNTAIARVYLCNGVAAATGTCYADHAMVNTGASALVWSPGTIQ